MQLTRIIIGFTKFSAWGLLRTPSRCRVPRFPTGMVHALDAVFYAFRGWNPGRVDRGHAARCRCPVDCSDARRTDPRQTCRCAAPTDAQRRRRDRTLPLPARRSALRRRQGHLDRSAVQQSQGCHARGIAPVMGGLCEHAAARRGAVRSARRRGDDPARQGLSRRGPGPDPADREWRGDDGDLVRARHRGARAARPGGPRPSWRAI